MRSLTLTTLSMAAVCGLVLVTGCSNKASISKQDMSILTHKTAPAPMPASARATIAAQAAAWQKAHAAPGQPANAGPPK